MFCCEVWEPVFPPGTRGVNGAALAACVENVDFLLDCNVDGVNEGDSTLRVFFPDLQETIRTQTKHSLEIKHKEKPSPQA